MFVLARAPVVGHINASLGGLTTIRASKAQQILIKEFDKHLDLNSSSTYMVISAARCFGYYLDLLCLVYIATIIATFLTISLGKKNLQKLYLRYKFAYLYNFRFVGW